ncbi:MAG: hypothetical protein ACI4OY_03545 [Aristaeellaceae bacterium]
MKDWKRIGKRLLFPGRAVLLAGVPLAAALLAYAFAVADGKGIVSYAAFAFSAYMTVAVCAAVPRLVREASVRAHRTPWLHRYLTDAHVRMHVSLYLSLGINMLYAVMKLLMGAYYRSVWFGTLGVYYALLTALRFMLLGHVRRKVPGEEQASELKLCRLCGAVLIPMTIALSGVVILVLDRNEGFRYAGYLIYVAAMYAFYAVISAAVNLVKYKKYHSPVMSAAKAVSLASALVSIFALETAMLSQFGEGRDVLFRQVMTSATGAGVCAIILGMAAVMMIHATRRLKALQADG